MPMTWGPDTDAKLFAAVLKVHDIKVNYAALAAEMGPECTAKAITHRIAKIKSESKTSGPAPASPAAPSTPKRARTSLKATSMTPKTPISTTTKGRARRTSSKPMNYAQSDESHNDSEDVYDEAKEKFESEESPSKKVKQESFDDGAGASV